jgi:hypothetical protein
LKETWILNVYAGRMLLNFPAGSQHSIDLEKFSAGMYVLQLKQANNFWTERIVRQ